MKVVITIDGRDALPVWTIPYVTAGIISADMLLQRLVEPEYAIPVFPSAFNLDDNKPSLIPPEWWAETKLQIALLDEELGFTALERSDWRNRSIGIITQNNRNCYIWLDEFKAWFDRRTINCTHFDLYLTPSLSAEHELYFKETEQIANRTTPDDGASAIKNHVAGRHSESVSAEESNGESFQELAITPRTGGYATRDNFVIKLIENKPELLGMRPFEIKATLKATSNLFTSGYPDWWRNNPIFKKGKPGRLQKKQGRNKSD